MKRRSGARLICLLLAGLLLTACTGLPTSGPPNAGLAVGEDGEQLVLTPEALGPLPGDTPEGIVAGFLEASKTPADSWAIARQFLTPEFAQKWRPETSVSIDTSVEDRRFTQDVADEDDKATSAVVRVELDQVATIDADGAYSAADSGRGKATYRLVRDEGGEWRISEGRDGITLDVDIFDQVYEKHSLRYFDQNWTRLVSDLRWFPRRAAMATAITRQLISGKPSAWLAPAVRNAFTSDITLIGDAVPVDDQQVASVQLSRAALSASPTELARMRTQLEASLAGAGVAEVRFIVDGVPLEARTERIDDTIVDPGVLVLTDEGFGTASAGGKIAPVTALSAQIGEITDPIASIDVALDGLLAAVQLKDGRVFTVAEGKVDLLDDRKGLVTPSLDPFGFTWTVPASAPQDVRAWSPDVAEHRVAKAWPGAESISALRVAADGTQVAAVVTSGGQRQLVVAAIIRDGDQRPKELGEPFEIAHLDDAVRGIAWIGTDTVAVLGVPPEPELTTYLVGGPASSTSAPEDAVSVAGAKSVTGMRVLSAGGVVSAQRGSFWQEAVSGVHVLGTRAGY